MYISTLLGHMHMHTYMWQSWVEIEHYSVAYFAHIAVFKALLRETSIKGGAHTCWVNSSTIATFAHDV